MISTAPAHGPEGPGEIDPAMVKLAVTVMHITVFFSLLGLGYSAEHALALTASIGLGSTAIADRFLSRRRDEKPRDQR